jgi:hypothetical protein
MMERKAANGSLPHSQLLAPPAHRLHGGLPRPYQITHYLMRRVRNPDAAQFASAVQLRQAQGIAPVGLYPLAGPSLDQR